MMHVRYLVGVSLFSALTYLVPNAPNLLKPKFEKLAIVQFSNALHLLPVYEFTNMVQIWTFVFLEYVD